MQNELKSLTHIDQQLLQAYADRRTATSYEGAIVRHLSNCAACAGQYAGLLLRTRIKPVAAPPHVWSDIQARLNGAVAPTTSRRRTSLYFRVGLAASVVLLTGLLFASWRYNLWRTPESRLDLGPYLVAAEYASPGTTAVSLRANFAGFRPCDQKIALSKARLTSQVANYTLVEQQSTDAGARSVVQLLYASDSDAFAVFVVPRESKLDFGIFHLTDAEVGGRRCRRADCPRQDVYLYTTSTRNYVFVHRHKSTDQSDQLFGELIRGAS